MKKPQTKTQALNQVAENKDNYYPQCFSYAKRIVKRKTRTFTAEDIINGYNKTANPKPSTNNVWGAVFHNLHHSGVIKHRGYVKSTNPSSHSRPISVWILND